MPNFVRATVMERVFSLATLPNVVLLRPVYFTYVDLQGAASSVLADELETALAFASRWGSPRSVRRSAPARRSRTRSSDGMDRTISLADAVDGLHRRLA